MRTVMSMRRTVMWATRTIHINPDMRLTMSRWRPMMMAIRLVQVDANVRFSWRRSMMEMSWTSMISIPDNCHVVIVTMADMDYIATSIFAANSCTECKGKDENNSYCDPNHTSCRFALWMMAIIIIVVISIMIIVVAVVMVSVAMIPAAIANVNCE